MRPRHWARSALRLPLSPPERLVTSDPIRAAIGHLQAGDQVECRTARGDWFPAIVVAGVRNVRYGKAWKPAVAITGGDWTNVNWPVEDVRLAPAITRRPE